MEAVTQSEPSAELARVPGLDGPGQRQRPPFGGRRRLCNIIPVRFDRTFASEPYNAGELFLRPGDRVVVDTPKGPALAEVCGVVQRQVIERDRARRVIRKASEEDVEAHIGNREIARDAFKFCLLRIRSRELNMKLCQVEYMLDRSRVLFYFSAEKRVDFRQLVRDLARHLEARIEMRQIGVRDGAGLVGGIGPCGKELCCSSFLTTFRSVSIRHAKDQGLTLNPKKVSGMCGRLMCCLVYEHATYRAAKRGAPRVNRAVMTEKGAGVITEVHLLTRQVRIYLEDGTSETFPFRDVVVDNETIRRRSDLASARPSRPKRSSVVTRAGSNLDVEYQWDDAEAEPSDDDGLLAKRSGRKTDEGGDESRRRRRRPRRRRRRSGDDDPKASESASTQEKSQATSAEGQSERDGKPAGDQPAKRSSRRRRRRRPAGAGEGGERSAAQNQTAGEQASSKPSQAGSGDATEGAPRSRRRRRGRRKPKSSDAPSSGGEGGK